MYCNVNELKKRMQDVDALYKEKMKAEEGSAVKHPLLHQCLAHLDLVHIFSNFEVNLSN